MPNPDAKSAALLPDVALQPHQQRIQADAAQAAKDNVPFRSLLYQGLGSGKSLSSIAAAEAIGRPYVAVTPASLRANYVGEQKKFTTGTTPSAVMSLSQLARQGAPDGYDTAVFDEAARLRNPRSAQSQAAAQLAQKARNVVLLTGTPLTNRPGDFTPLYNMLTQQNLTPEGFEAKYTKDRPVYKGLWSRLLRRPVGHEQVLNRPKDLEAALKGHVDYYAAEKPEVPVERQDVDAEASPVQARLYRAMLGELPWHLRWKLHNDTPLSRPEIERLSSFLAGPRQVLLSPHNYGKDKDPLKSFANSGKLTKAYGLLQEELRDPRKKAIVYSNFLDAGLTPYSAALTRAGVPHAVFHGGLNDVQRKKVVDDFNANKIRVALLGPSGSEGISLKGASLLQVLDPHWNSVRTNQAEGRGLRYKSHEGLPPDLQYHKIQRFTSSLPLSTVDRLRGESGHTVDHQLYRLSREKDGVNQELLDLLKRVGTRAPTAAPVRTPVQPEAPTAPDVPAVQQPAHDPRQTLAALHQAKALSDAGDYRGKAAILQDLISKRPADWRVDSDDGGFVVGLSHRNGFRFHLPRHLVPAALGAATKAAGVLAHVAGPSGSGKTTLMNQLAAANPDVVTKDLDDFDDEAAAALGNAGVHKSKYDDTMLATLAAKRQEVMDGWLKGQDKPVVLGGHHWEGEHTLTIPPEAKKILLNTSPLLSSWRAYRRSQGEPEQFRRKLTELPADWAEARRDRARLADAGYTPTSAENIKQLLSTKAAADDLTAAQLALQHLGGWRDNPVTNLVGGASPVTAAVGTGALGAAAGYGTGWLADKLLPARKRARLPDSLPQWGAVLGGLLGATPGHLVGRLNTLEGRPYADSSMLKGARAGLLGLLEAAGMDPAPRLGDSGLAKVAAALWGDAATPRGQFGPRPSGFDAVPTIDAHAFPHALRADYQTPYPLGDLAASLVDRAAETKGSRWVTPIDVARVAASAGVGWAAGLAVGKALGALAGLPPAGQAKLQRAGLWAGVLTSTLPLLTKRR